MSDLSEEFWRAGWLSSLEYLLWRAIKNHPSQDDGFILSDEEARQLRLLSEQCGGWIYFDDVTGETFLPLKPWEAEYALHEARRKPSV